MNFGIDGKKGKTICIKCSVLDDFHIPIGIHRKLIVHVICGIHQFAQTVLDGCAIVTMVILYLVYLFYYFIDFI